MLNGRTAAVLLIIGCLVVGAGLAQNPAAAPDATVVPAASPAPVPAEPAPAPASTATVPSSRWRRVGMTSCIT